MRAFERYFCTTGVTDENLIADYVEALSLDRGLGGADKANALERIMRDRAAEQAAAYAARLQSREVRIEERKAAYAVIRKERLARRTLERPERSASDSPALGPRKI